MARTRPDVAPDVKRDAIVGVATRRFSEAGYDDTSMASVARDAGVSVNTVYWYFANKDALFVAVLDHLQAQWSESEASRSAMTLLDRILAASYSFDDLGKIVTALHARAAVSELAGRWHAQYHRQAERALMIGASRHLEGAGLPPVSERSRRTLARLWVYALDGIITHDVPPSVRRELCAEMVAQLERTARASMMT